MKFLSVLALLWMSFVAQGAPLKLAFVYVSPVGDAGWSYSHDLGRKQIEKEFSGEVETQYFESVPEGRKSRVFLAKLAEEYDMIFTTSWGYMVATQKISEQYPNVKFEHATGIRQGHNLSTYATRVYEARYLAGMLAAGMSETGNIGYVAAYPIPEVVRGINAFTLGAKSINSEVSVNVKWLNSWYNPSKAAKLSNQLIDEGADVLTQHTDTPVPVEVAEKRGVYAIGYHSDMSQFGPNSHLASVVHDWGAIYAQKVKALLNNEWQSGDSWTGLKDSTTRLVSINPKIPNHLMNKVNLARKAIESGEMSVFSGPIKNHRGRVRVKPGRDVKDDDLKRMNWYVQGVKGDLKFF